MTRVTRAGGLPGQRDPADPGHLHEQVHGGRHLLPLRHAGTVQYSTLQCSTVQYVTYNPFDMQLCELKFASWTTEVTRVSVVW